MGKLVVSEFITLDGVAEDPGGAEQTAHGGWAFQFDRGPEGDAKPHFPDLFDACARLGVDGIELLGVQFPDTTPAALYPLKQQALQRGVAIVAVSAHHNFVQPDAGKRREEIDKLCRWVDVARFRQY